MNKEKVLKFIRKNYKWIIAFVILSGIFYWYEMRPSQIKKDCHISAKETAEKWVGKLWEQSSRYSSSYEACLNKKGL